MCCNPVVDCHSCRINSRGVPKEEQQIKYMAATILNSSEKDATKKNTVYTL